MADNEYENLRAENIERNRLEMLRLGFAPTVAETVAADLEKLAKTAAIKEHKATIRAIRIAYKSLLPPRPTRSTSKPESYNVQALADQFKHTPVPSKSTPREPLTKEALAAKYPHRYAQARKGINQLGGPITDEGLRRMGLKRLASGEIVDL